MARANGSTLPQQGRAEVDDVRIPRGSARVAASESLAPRAQGDATTASDVLVTEFAHSTPVQEWELEQALRDFFFQQSRLPPSGATAFDPRLTPEWAGVKLPG